MPCSAKAVLFVTLEDETGVAGQGRGVPPPQTPGDQARHGSSRDDAQALSKPRDIPIRTAISTSFGSMRGISA